MAEETQTLCDIRGAFSEMMIRIGPRRRIPLNLVVTKRNEQTLFISKRPRFDINQFYEKKNSIFNETYSIFKLDGTIFRHAMDLKKKMLDRNKLNAGEKKKLLFDIYDSEKEFVRYELTEEI